MIPKFKNGEFVVKFHQHERTSLSKVAEMARTLSKMQPIHEALHDAADDLANAAEELLNLTTTEKAE